MGRTNIVWFLLLLLIPLSVPSISIERNLKSIIDLNDKGIIYGKIFPQPGLKLLYWFARKILINNNNIIDISNIFLSKGSYGFHPFRNNGGLITSVIPNVVYYALGNLNPRSYPGSSMLPGYVTEDFYNTKNNQLRNVDRIIVECEQNTFGSALRVFISYHYKNVYEISPQLLREIQKSIELSEFLKQAGYDFDLRNFFYDKIFGCNSNNWHARWWSLPDSDPYEISPQPLREIPNFQTLEEFPTHAGYDSMDFNGSTFHFTPRYALQRSLPECDTSEGLKLDLRSDDTAKARITWSNIPNTILTKNLVLNVYANMDSSDSEALKSYSVAQQQSGFIDTSVRLNSGLQVRLMEETGSSSPRYQYTPIWASPEFDEGNWKLPTDVGYDASLQLFVKQGKACARLYIKKCFFHWKDTFKNSWVGFYKSSDDNNYSYATWQWAIYFKENQDRDTDEYQAYEYESGLDIHHDVEARFFLSRDYDLTATTPPWANEVIKKHMDVVGYDASLQPFAKKGKVCARLYIGSSFTNWEDKFYWSWVGFYNLMDDGHSSYKDYQWVTKLKENPDKNIETTRAYEYESGLDVNPGVQVRFFLNSAYSSVLARTVPWGEEAIREIQNNVRDYDASLQLIESGGKVCARLYIERTFTNWDSTFYYSWVGFYSSSYAQSDSYYTWQWVTKFSSNEDKDTEEYMAYEYYSSMAVGSGVEVRFFLSRDYSQEKCQTGFRPDPYVRLAVSRAVKH